MTAAGGAEEHKLQQDDDARRKATHTTREKKQSVRFLQHLDELKASEQEANERHAPTRARPKPLGVTWLDHIEKRESRTASACSNAPSEMHDRISRVEYGLNGSHPVERYAPGHRGKNGAQQSMNDPTRNQ